MAKYFAGIDIGGTKMTAALADKDRIIIKLYQKVRLAGDNTAIPGQAAELVDTACREAGIPLEKVSEAGISTASPFVLNDRKKVLVSTNLCGGLAPERNIIPNDWTEIPLEETLLTRFDRVVIENDCVAAASAEHTFGAGRGVNNMVYVTWSTGIGAGCIVDGRILQGKNSNAGHGGHIYIADDGPQCGCGNVADLESLTSGPAIARAFGANSSTREVFTAYRKNNEHAKSVVRSAARYFGRGLASINAILDTQMFVLGGSVFLNNEDILLPLVTEEFYKSFPSLSTGVRFERSVLDDCLGDIAALSLVIQDSWKERWFEAKLWETAPEAIILHD